MKFMRAITLTLVMAAALAGCAYGPSQQQINMAQSKIAARAEQCAKGKLTRQNALERRSCIDEAWAEELTAIRYPFMHTIYDVLAMRKRAAVEYAEGRQSKAKYEAMLSQIDAYAKNAEVYNIQQAQLRQQIALQNFQQSMSNLQTQELMRQQAYQSSLPQRTNCHVVGNNINCTSW